MTLMNSIKEWTSVDLRLSFGQYYFPYINVTLDISITNKKNLKIDANYVFYLKLKGKMKRNIIHLRIPILQAANA